ncbi:MAG: winged helix-turn-helix domain-containing protein [Myxococcota bacterium]
MTELTSAEARVLAVLREHPGQIFDRDTLSEAAGLAPKDPLSRCIDATVSRLRRKLGEAAAPLATEFGTGYRWGPPLEPPPPSPSSPRLRLGDAEVDLERAVVLRAGTAVALTTLEARVLRRLARTPGEPVATEDLGPRGAVPRLVLRLRRKLGAPELITAQRGVGYTLAAPRREGGERFTTLAREAATLAGTTLQLEDVVVYRRTGALLEQVAAWGPKQDDGGQVRNPLRLAVGTGIVGAAAACRRVEYVPDTRHDHRYIPDLREARSELVTPILVRGEVVGLFDSEASLPASFTERHRAGFEALARLLSASL